MLRALLIIVPLASVYWFWLRPLLKQRPGLRELYAQEADIFRALRFKLAGLKQKLTGALLIAAAAAVECHDQLAPLVAGVDFTPITSRVPAEAWPVVVAGSVLLLNWFRKLADKRAAGQ